MDDGAPPVWRPRTLDVAGVRVAMLEAGNTAPGARTALLLHGLGHWTDAAWGRLVPLLDPSLRYVGFDLPGFGASDKPDVAYDVAFYRTIIDGVVAQLRADRFALVGHSLGGFLAADYAGRTAERVERLALIAPAAFSRTPRHLVFAIAAACARGFFVRTPSRRLVARILHGSVVDPASLEPAITARAHELAQDAAVRRAFAAVYAGGVRVFANARTLRAACARYRGPVFCAWGRHDRYISVATLRDVLRIYPHAHTLVLERSAHLPMVEEPTVLAAALRTFLA